MEYLTEELFDKLYDKYDEAIVDTIRLEKKAVNEKISFLKGIGIKDIESILLKRIDIFLWDTDDLTSSFTNNQNLVELINEDIMYIMDI